MDRMKQVEQKVDDTYLRSLTRILDGEIDSLGLKSRREEIVEQFMPIYLQGEMMIHAERQIARKQGLWGKIVAYTKIAPYRKIVAYTKIAVWRQTRLVSWLTSYTKIAPWRKLAVWRQARIASWQAIYAKIAVWRKIATKIALYTKIAVWRKIAIHTKIVLKVLKKLW